MTNSIAAQWSIRFDELPNDSQVQAAEHLARALEEVASFPNVGMTLIWRGSEARIPYAYGLTDSLEDVLFMMEALSNMEGEHHFCLSSDEQGLIDVDFRLRWSHDILRVDAAWRYPSESQMSPCVGDDSISIPKERFVSSWLKMLGHISDSLCHITLSDSDEQLRIEALRATQC